MFNLCIIGLGALGRRHLEGALKSGKIKSLTVIDPNQQSIAQTKEIVKAYKTDIEVKYFHKINPVKSKYDITIVATNSNIRLEVIQRFFEFNKTDIIILEKILFNKINQYPTAKQIIFENNAICYVNTPRREWTSYTKLLEELKNHKNIISLAAEGENWGMATSTIHMLDLFSYLTNDSQIARCKCMIQSIEPHPKRPGYLDFHGKITGLLGNNTKFKISSKQGTGTNLKITIKTELDTFIIDEMRKTIRNNSSTKDQPFETLYVSETTEAIINKIADKNSILLPTLEHSSYLHLSLLGALEVAQEGISNRIT